MIRAVRPAVVAHRGASAHRAEHTVAAYALALEQGAEGLECDVRLTRDGHLVCVHDRKVDRTSNGRGVVSTLTLERMSELDYSTYDPAMPDHADDLLPERMWTPEPGDRGVLTLESLLDLVADWPGTRLFIETKHPVRYGGLVEAKLVALLARHGLARPKSHEESPIVVMSFSSQAVRRIKRHAPQLPTVMLVGSRMTPSVGDYVGPSIERLREDPGYVERAGRPTYCWTVDEPADVRLCQRLGVRFIATNKPAATLEVLRGTVPESEPSR
jgi:glycerophosphoryl diester phosphodiesterase